MKLAQLAPGTYVVAVSGGVDSVVLLDLLSQQKNLTLVVAHLDHGIREDSPLDADLARDLAKKYGVSYETKRVELGKNASESAARKARYAFLESVKEAYRADAIVTAHHQDDLIETAILNTLRGTHRKGLVSLRNRPGLLRPLLPFSKKQIIEYARSNNLVWREDSTNSNARYLRNKIRRVLAVTLTPSKRKAIIALLSKVEADDKSINAALIELLEGYDAAKIDKNVLKTDEKEAYEIAAAWLRQNNVAFDEATIKRLVTGVKTLKNNAKIDLKDNYYAVVKRDVITIEHR